MLTSASQIQQFLCLILLLVIGLPASERPIKDPAAWGWAPHTFLTGPVVTFCYSQTDYCRPTWTLDSGVVFRQTVALRSRTRRDLRVGSSHLLTGPDCNSHHIDWIARHQYISQHCSGTDYDNRRSRGWAPLTTLTGPYTHLTTGLDTLAACSHTAADLHTRHLDSTGTPGTFLRLGVGSLLLWTLAQGTLFLHTYFTSRRVGSSRFFALARQHLFCDSNIGVGSHARFALALGLILFFRLHLHNLPKDNNQIFANWDPEDTGCLRIDSRGTALLFSAGELSGSQQHIQDWRQTENRDWAPLQLFSGPKAHLVLDTTSLFDSTVQTFSHTEFDNNGVGSLSCDSLAPRLVDRPHFFGPWPPVLDRVGSLTFFLAQIQTPAYFQILAFWTLAEYIYLGTLHLILIQFFDTALNFSSFIITRHWLHTCCTPSRELQDTVQQLTDPSAAEYQTRLWCRPGPKSRDTSDCTYLRLQFLKGCVRSEGCIFVMENAEVLPDWTPRMLLESGTKTHDTRPETCTFAKPWHPNPRPVVKRSIKRAYARALTHGVAWYRGRCLVPTDFPKALTSQPRQPQKQPKITPPTNLIHCNQKHQDAKRFRLLQWNAGGLALHRLDAVKVWMLENQLDAAMIVETRWTYESEWSDPDFHYIHSGDKTHRGMGILCILSRKLCKADHLRWRVVVPGRLLHVQVQMHNRHLDLIGCYQHTQASHSVRQQERQQWWSQLDSLLHSLAHRNVLALTGDFNCNLVSSPTHSGPEQYRWGTQMTSGAMHPDAGQFTSLLRMHGLTALNTWDQGLGPTYVHAQQHSRIDFIITRKTVADGASKQVCYAWDAPFCSSHSGHVPMIAQLRKTWYNARDLGDSITSKQIAKGYQAFRCNTDLWQQFITSMAQDIAHMDLARTSDETFIPTLHAKAIQAYHLYFPHEPAHCTTDQTTTNLVMNKWTHRKHLLQLDQTDPKTILQAWFHLTRFRCLNRQSKRHAREVRQLRFQTVVEEAQQAAQRHDSHALFKLIHKYSPKQPRRRMQLRTAHGNIATPIEETAMLRKFVMDTWSGPSTFATPQLPFSGMPFTADDLASELSRIPACKAVARPCAPGVVWKSLSSHIAGIIFDQLVEWWSRPTPFLPGWFRDSWMILIPKPHKPPVTPGALRPLALQEPISKCLVGLLTKQAMYEALPHMTPLPLWAYMPGRGTHDALLRVANHCRETRALMQTLRSTPFIRQSRAARPKVAGGLQLFLDIERAFDLLSRERLFGQLHKLGISPQIIQLLSLWHQQTQYHLKCHGTEIPIQVGKGVHQGCRAAPLLWNGYMWLFLMELSRITSPQWANQCLNVYADDCQMGDVFRSTTELQALLDNINKTLMLLQRFDLSINANKCTALLAIGGTSFRQVRADLVLRKDGAEWLRFGTADQPIWIPLGKSTKYLGCVITYSNFEDATIQHRLQLTKIAFHRLKRWLTSSRGLRKAQRLQLFTSCIYPILTYGIYATGLTQQGILLIQRHMYSLLRQVLCNHAYITGQTHQSALIDNNVDQPAAWLWSTAETLQRSFHARLAKAHIDDIIHTLDWSHLQEIFELLQHHLCTGSTAIIATSVTDVPSLIASLTCQQCGFSTQDVASFRRHCTIQHDQPMHRTIPVEPAHFQHAGMPQCKYCLKKFTTWRSFTTHIQRGCQVLQAGPATCWRSATQVFPVDRPLIGTMFAPKLDPAVRGTAILADTDLRNIQSQEWGQRILTIVGSRTWHHMKKETEACSYLAQRCCLCDQFLGRTQEMHRHYKLHHPEFWPHMQEKGHQLTNLHGEDPPCPYCGALFKAAHQCPVWCQLAMLLIYGGGICPGTSEVPAVMRCEICLETFSSGETLHEHLTQVHRLPSQSYNPARDSLAGEPVCAHCHTMYDNLESLRSHINQGRCVQFNPALPTEVIDVLPQWVDAMCHGNIANVLRDPHVRLQLTLRCQNCSCRYTRPADLAGHLQSAHSRLWSAAQVLTGIMTELLYNEAGCTCNPSITTPRVGHVCLPLRQLSMQHLRMGEAILFPHRPTDEELAQLFSENLPRESKFMLERTLTAGTLHDFWTQATHMTLLRTTCFLCGMDHHPADLVIHMYEAHQSGLPIVKFLKHQLVVKFVEASHDTPRCFACQQVFTTVDSPDQAAEQVEQQTAAHFRAQCPVVLQTAVLLSKAAHGRHEHARSRRNQSAGVAGLSGHWSPSGRLPPPGAQCSRTQAPKKRRTSKDQGSSSQPAAAGEDRRGTRPVTDGKADNQTGPRSSATETGRHIHLLLRAQRPQQQPEPPSESHGGLDTTETIHDVQASPDALETTPDASGVQHAADPPHQAWGDAGWIRGAESGNGQPDFAPGQDLPIPRMGHESEAAESGTENPTVPHQVASTLPGHAGGPDRCPPGHSLSCLADQQPRSGSMETDLEPTSRYAVANNADTVPLGYLAPHGNIAEATWTETESTGAELAASHGHESIPQRTRERQIQAHDAQAGVNPTIPADLSSWQVDPREMLQHLAHLTLQNPGNYCFANAAAYCFLWTTLSTEPCEMTVWGQQRQYLTDFMLDHQDNAANLCDEEWFQEILRCWGAMDPALDHSSLAQQDAAEFVHVWFAQLQGSAFRMGWEQRLDENGRTIVFDHGHHAMPVCLKFEHPFAHAMQCDLSQLFERWRQVHGMCTALVEASPCL